MVAINGLVVEERYFEEARRLRAAALAPAH